MYGPGTGLRPVLHWWLTATRSARVLSGELRREWKARKVKKQRIAQLLHETAVELAEGEELIAEKKQAKKKAKSKLERKNAERSAALIEETVKSIVEHRRLLKREAAGDPSKGSRD
jgi:hypothetical protein